MVGDDVTVRAAYTPSLAGATVPLDGTVGIGEVAQVGSLTIPGVPVPWSVVLAPMSPAGGNPGAKPNRLRVTLGLHGGGATFDVDAPLTGGMLQLPPSESLTLGLVVNNTFAALPGRMPSSQRVAFAPAHHGLPTQAMPLVYTEPMAGGIASAASIIVARPPMASSYRVLSTSDPAGFSLSVAQMSGPTVIEADASSATAVFGAAWERSTWLPLSPICNALLVINSSPAVKDLAVQWRIGDW